MARSLRFQRFLFEPARFKHDPAVMAMCPEARGLYAILFCSAWDMPEPGVLPADPSVLAPLAFASTEQWACHGPAIARAFDTSSRPGSWVSTGMVETHRAQSRTNKARSIAGKRGAIALHGNNVNGHAMAPTSELAMATVGGAGSGVGSGAGSGNGKKNQERGGKRATIRLFVPASIEDQADCVARFAGLSDSTVSLLAERVNLEGPGRGYKSGRSALLNWCKIECERMAAHPQQNGKAIADAACAQFLAEDSDAQV